MALFSSKSEVSFYKKSVVFSIISIAASAFGYFLYPIISRVIDVESYGEFTVYMSLITQISAVFLSFNAISIYVISEYGEDKAKIILSSIQKIISLFSLVIIILFILFMPQVNLLLKIHSQLGGLIFAIILIFSITGSIWSGYFQGKSEIVRVSVYNLVNALIRIVAVTLLALSLGMNGALIGVLIAYILSLLLLWIYPGPKPPKIKSLTVGKADRIIFKKFYGLIVRSTLAVIILAFAQSADIIGAKILYNPEIAGQYAGVSTISKIIFFTGFIVVWIVLPEIKKANPKHALRLTKKTYVLFATMGIVSLAIAILAGNSILSYLIGSSYVTSNYTIALSVLFQLTMLYLSFIVFTLMTFNYKSILQLLLPVIIGYLITFTFALSGLTTLLIGFNLTNALCSLTGAFILYKIIIGNEKL